MTTALRGPVLPVVELEVRAHLRPPSSVGPAADLGSGTLSSCGEHQVGALMDHHVSTFQGAVAVPPFGRSFHFATRWNVRSRVQHLVVDLYELTFAHLPDNQFG